jgi:hypothetical protein
MNGCFERVNGQQTQFNRLAGSSVRQCACSGSRQADRRARALGDRSIGQAKNYPVSPMLYFGQAN